MKVLKVIHGYPLLYNAGSKFYSQLICHGLENRHEVHVFTREENPFAKDFSIRHAQDTLQPLIKLHLINIPLKKFRYHYRHQEVDQDFIDILNEVSPNVIHVEHLNHLST